MATPHETAPAVALKRLEDLLKMKVFPALPNYLEHSELVMCWHSKVSTWFTELKTCGPAGFKTICSRLKGELKVRV